MKICMVHLTVRALVVQMAREADTITKDRSQLIDRSIEFINDVDEMPESGGAGF